MLHLFLESSCFLMLLDIVSNFNTNFITLKNKMIYLLGEYRNDLGEGNGNPLQYSCLENSMGEGTW